VSCYAPHAAQSACSNCSSNNNQITEPKDITETISKTREKIKERSKTRRKTRPKTGNSRRRRETKRSAIMKHETDSIFTTYPSSSRPICEVKPERKNDVDRNKTRQDKVRQGQARPDQTRQHNTRQPQDNHKTTTKQDKTRQEHDFGQTQLVSKPSKGSMFMYKLCSFESKSNAEGS
jgi:hypothetical protein